MFDLLLYDGLGDDLVETLDVTSGDWGLAFLLSFEGVHVFLREVE